MGLIYHKWYVSIVSDEKKLEKARFKKWAKEIKEKPLDTDLVMQAFMK